MVMNGSIPSKRFEVWQRLYARFLLEPEPAEGSEAAVSSLVVPTTDADLLIRRIAVHQGSSGHAAGTAETLVAFTVPVGIRLTVRAWDVRRISGDNTFTRIQLNNVLSNAFVMLVDGVSSNGLPFPDHTPLTLQQGDEVHITSEATGVAATEFRWSAWCDEEDLF